MKNTIKILVLISILFSPYSFGIKSVSEMDIQLLKMKSISSSSSCIEHSECSSITLGWKECAIENIEFAINANKKSELKLFLKAADKYEKLWVQAVEQRKIPLDCRVQKFSKTECKEKRCVLIGPQKTPEIPLIEDPNFYEKILKE